MMLHDIPMLERQIDLDLSTNYNSNSDKINDNLNPYSIDSSHGLIKRDKLNKKHSSRSSRESISTQISTSLTDDELVTVYTHVSGSRSNAFSINLIVPTITTNNLPFASSGLDLNSTIPVSINSYNYYSRSINNNTNSYKGYSTSSLSSLYPSVSTYMDPILSSLTSKSKSKTSSRSISKMAPKTSSSLYLPTVSSLSSSSLLASSYVSSTSSYTKARTTITEYLEDITYTQVYVITDSKYTLTTSLLATTALYVDSLYSTYSISPPAITTDINALRSRTDFRSIFNHGLSKGSIAGIAVGSILGFLLILSILLFYLLKKRKNSFINKLFSSNKSNFNDSSYIHDNLNDSDDDDYNNHTHNTTFDYSRSSLSPIDPIGPIIPTDSQKRIPPIPPIPSRSNKPPIAPIISTTAKSPDIDTNALILPETPINLSNPNNIFDISNSDQNKKGNNISSSNNNQNIDDNINDDNFDLSLFDMKSTLNAINASTEVNHHLMPPVPPARKSLSSNRIDKMNHKVNTLSLLSPSQLPIDRTMGVLYESPNEQCIWDEFEGAKKYGSMYDSTEGSPIDSVFGAFELKNKNKNYKSHYMEQLNCTSDYDDNLKNNLLDSNRVRSGSGAKRYEHLANNVNIIKHELEKERLASPLSITDDKFNDNVNNDGNSNFESSSSLNKPHTKAIPPPVPKPRKNINNNVNI